MRVRLDERAVHHRAGRGVLGLQQEQRQRLEQRQVAAETDLQEPVGQHRAAAHDSGRPLRVAEAHQPRLRQRVDRHDPGAARFARSNAVSMRGWLVPGF
ncbi:hypothetical protein GCM10027612_27180 [Microbispora bryophytorum subsp. camponoti]